MEKDKLESRTDTDIANKIADVLNFEHDRCGGGHHADPCERCGAIIDILEVLTARPSVPQQGQAAEVFESLLDLYDHDALLRTDLEQAMAALAASRSEEATAQKLLCPSCGSEFINCSSCGSGSVRKSGAPAAGSTERDSSIQKRVTKWAIRCFGEEHVLDPQVRGMRLLEEAIEFAQAVGVPTDKCKSIIDYVYSRPSGKPSQELGGVAITAFAAATAIQENFFDVTMAELSRIEAKSPEHFTARNQTKIDLGFNSGALAGTDTAE